MSNKLNMYQKQFAAAMKLVRKAGEWWVITPKPYSTFGPYVTKGEATLDYERLARTFAEIKLDDEDGRPA